LFEKIKKGQYDFPSPSWDNISKDAIDIIKKLIVVDSSQRMSPDELLKLPWINGITGKNNDKEILIKMKEWNSKRKLK